MPLPMKGVQADHRSFMLDTLALGSRSHAVEVPAPPTLAPSDSYDPIVPPRLANPCRLSGYGIRPHDLVAAGGFAASSP